MTALMPSEELPRRGGGNGGKREGDREEEEEGAGEKEVQQSGVLSCFSVTLPSFS